MGDTAPPQAPAGGLGGAPGAGLLGGGSVTPRVHSAIVERLRARIAVCRQHHLSCEGRYERGRAESSDRERESTLQLLSLVQHGQGARKAGKHTKATATAANTTAPPPPPAAPPTSSQAAATAAPPPPPDYHHHHQQHLLSSSNNGGGGGIDGEQQPPPSTPGDQRNSALIAVRHLVFSWFWLWPCGLLWGWSLPWPDVEWRTAKRAKMSLDYLKATECAVCAVLYSHSSSFAGAPSWVFLHL